MNSMSEKLQTRKLRIAVIGAGIAGLASAWFLSRKHSVSLFEANHYAGGHTNTVDVTLEGLQAPVDTGFLVFNERTYPNLLSLFSELGVRHHESQMSFAVSMNGGEMEWAGNNLQTLFAQKKNLFSPAFLGMVKDILRFNRASALYEAEAGEMTLGELLDKHRYGNMFADCYLLPMAASIWSSPAEEIRQFPAVSFIRFCQNHGLLQIMNRPQWYTVSGGGREYVRRIVDQLEDVRLSMPVIGVSRRDDKVLVSTANHVETFDAVVMATHAPTSLRLLDDVDEQERQVLGAIRYEKNLAWLHTDTRLLPKRRSLWSAWNYLGNRQLPGASPVCVSYLINQLQPLPFKSPVIVTLNPFFEPEKKSQLASFEYEHPVMDSAALRAQRSLPSIQGKGHIWHAGAWTGYGFHEDGLKSALRVASAFDVLPEWARL